MSGNPPDPPRAGLLAALREILTLFRSERPLLGFVLLVNLLGAGLTGIADPISLKLLIDSLARHDLRFFLLLTGLMVLVYTGFRTVSYVSDLFSQKLKNRVSQQLSTRLLRSFYRLPYARVSSHDNGYFIARLYDEPTKVTTAVNLVVDLFSSLAICACAVGVCLFLSWRVSLLVLLVVPLLVILSNRYGRRIRSRSLEENEAEAQLRDGLGRAIGSYKNVRIFGLHDQVFRSFDRLLGLSLGSTYARYKQAATFRTLSGISLSTAETGVMVAAGIQVLQGQLSIGGLFGFVSAYWRVVNSFGNLTNLVASLANLAAQIERVQELESVAEVAPRSWPPRREYGVRDLSLGFDGQAVLTDFDFQWRLGEKVLVVGPNGSGKSSLAHVLTGLLEAPAGELRIPGLERVSALLSPFGFIPGSLRDNLAHTGSSAERRAAVADLVATLELSDKLDRDPTSLSDGEKKRAQVVMTLAKDADCYIFDEPLANVDPGSKDAIMESILERTAGRSLIVILHGDDQYRRRFDRVVDLRPREQLATLSG